MAASTDQPAAPADRPHLWRPASVAFLAVSLAALAAGAMPELFIPRDRAGEFAAPPAMGLMLAAQVVFVLLLSTLLVRPRAGSAAGAYLLASLAEFAVLVAASAPLYVIAAWLSDGAVRDVARCLLYLAAVATAAWGLGQWTASSRPAALTVVALLAAVAAVGAPVVCYLLAELADSPAGGGWLSPATPATFGFRLADRSPDLLVGPVWAWLLWPAVGAAAMLARLLAPKGRLAP